MGRSKRTEQPSNDASLCFGDNVLGGLAEELKDAGLTATFIQNKVEGGACSCVDVYHKSGMKRIRVTMRFNLIAVNQTCGEQIIAGSAIFELSDPDSIQKIINHIVGRIKFWEDMERISELDQC